MATINPYLQFNGNTEEVFNFYKSVFGGEFAAMQRYSEMPPSPEMGEMPEGAPEKIMHVALPIGEKNLLMGSDVLESMGQNFTIGDNFSVCISAESKDEADKVFGALATDGKVTMPLADAFWGDYFGMLTDRFGIQWMVSFNEKYSK
jgi:PhnB protein